MNQFFCFVLIVIVTACRAVHAHPFHFPSAMADVGKTVDTFTQASTNTLSVQFSGNALNPIQNTLLGKTYGIRDTGPSPEELSYMLPALHLLSFDMEIDDISQHIQRARTHQERQHLEAISAFIFGLKLLEWGDVFQNQNELSQTLQENNFNAALSNLTANRLWHYLSMDAYHSIAQSNDRRSALQQALLDQQEKKKLPEVQATVNELKGIVNELRQSEPMKLRNDREYPVYNNYIDIAFSLHKNKQAILKKASDIWDDLLRNRVYYKESASEFRTRVESAWKSIINQKDSLPCFEDLISVGLDANTKTLPNSPDSKVLSMAVIRSHLSSGVELFKQAVDLLRKKPQLKESFRPLIVYQGYCVPVHNGALEDWIKVHTISRSLIDTIYMHARDASVPAGGDVFGRNIGNIIGDYENYLFEQAQKHTIDKYGNRVATLTRDRLTDYTTERSWLLIKYFDPFWTVNHATDWIYERVKEAYEAKNNLNAWRNSDFADKNKIRQAVISTYMFD